MKKVPFESRWGFNFDCEWFGETESFTLACLRFEREPHVGCIAWQIGLLGFLWTGTFLYNTTYVVSLAAQIEELMNKNKNKEGAVNDGTATNSDASHHGGNSVVNNDALEQHRVPDSEKDVLPPPK